MNQVRYRDQRPRHSPREALPRIGAAGSRSAELHHDSPLVTAVSGTDLASRHTYAGLGFSDQLVFAVVRWLGTVGALLLGLGALGAGALPVVDNPYPSFPGGTVLGQMLQAATVLCFLGIGLLVVAWLGMSVFVGIRLPGTRVRHGRVSVGLLWRTYAAWIIPLIPTAPLFTQDIYSYLAQGSIVRQGLDPYEAGPVDLLGTENPLSRSVPFIWAHSPSPYGPVALMEAKVVSWLTGDSIFWGIITHRLVGVAAIALAAWGLLALARRCHVNPSAAFWLGILNPLVLLHLVGGIHNESLMLGLMLAGVEVALRATDHLNKPSSSWRRAWFSLTAGTLLIAAAGQVKIPAFVALGFVGVAFARAAVRATHHSTLFTCWYRAIGVTALTQSIFTLFCVLAVSLSTGVGLGWITGQGGAASIRSWMSVSTDVGVIAGALGSWLGLGNHTESMLLFARGAGLIVAAGFIMRMLVGTYRGIIHPVGGLGVGLFVVVVFFPVVHPWYMLWAVLPLAAWANRVFFRAGVLAYSAAFSFFLLPRGLGLPVTTVLGIYLWSTVFFLIILISGWWLLRRAGFLPVEGVA